jgi:hypothetical protein
MAKKSNHIHTVSRPDGWGNLKAGASKVSKVYSTKAQAQAAGRKTAIKQKAEHIIHNQDGKIGSRNSYGNDPHPPRG